MFFVSVTKEEVLQQLEDDAGVARGTLVPLVQVAGSGLPVPTALGTAQTLFLRELASASFDASMLFGRLKGLASDGEPPSEEALEQAYPWQTFAAVRGWGERKFGVVLGSDADMRALEFEIIRSASLRDRVAGILPAPSAQQSVHRLLQIATDPHVITYRDVIRATAWEYSQRSRSRWLSESLSAHGGGVRWDPSGESTLPPEVFRSAGLWVPEIKAGPDAVVIAWHSVRALQSLRETPPRVFPYLKSTRHIVSQLRVWQTLPASA